MSNFDTAENRTSRSEERTIWNKISDPDEIETIIQKSTERLQLVYKHSTQCSISFLAKQELEEIAEKISEVATLHIVDVIRQRTASNAIATRLRVRHESPQVIVLKDGKIIWKGSHWEVKGENVIATLI